MIAISDLDGMTANAIRQALGAAGRGLLSEACLIGERALADGGDTVALNAMLGMFRCQSGAIDVGIAHLQVAHRARPADQKIAINLANALATAERHREAFDVLTWELAESDLTGHLLRLRGFLAQTLEDYPAAIEAYQRVVATDTADFESWNNLGNARRVAGDFEGGIDALRRAAQLAPDSPPIRLNLAAALIDAGEWIDAEDELREMAALFPDDPNPLRELYFILKQSGREEEALNALEEALKRAPNEKELLLGVASHLSLLMRAKDAETAYRRVLELEPNNTLAHLGLAVTFDLTNRAEELAQLVRQAEDRKIGLQAQSFIRAFDHRRAKRFAEGLAEIDQVPSSMESGRRAHLTGQLLEGVGRHDEAIEQYRLMNELLLKESPQAEDKAANYRNMVRTRLETVTREWVGRWRAEAGVDQRPAPAFLVGFPRSGTTLLDTMLMGHPSIEVLEEEPTLREAHRLLNFADLPLVSDDKIRAARDGYFKTAAALTPLHSGNLLVDKNPLNLNSVPYIRRLFPDARIILALRHPCDVVLSCYVTNFNLNDGMSSFARLDTAAELYDLSFQLFERVQDLMPTPTHVVKYEKVVADQDTELRALFDFLGLDWHDSVLDHQATAKGRGRIKTASYAQVVEPIYQRSAGRWQNYRKHLEPIFPVLRPWVEKFGYSLDEASA